MFFKKWLMSKRVNTDEWDADSPVFLSPKEAERLSIKVDPDYIERRTYVRPSDKDPSFLIPENNVGWVLLNGDEVTHRLLSRGHAETRKHDAVMTLRLGDDEAPGNE